MTADKTLKVSVSRVLITLARQTGGEDRFCTTNMLASCLKNFTHSYFLSIESMEYSEGNNLYFMFTISVQPAVQYATDTFIIVHISKVPVPCHFVFKLSLVDFIQC